MPLHPSELLNSHIPVRELRSSNQFLLQRPKTRLKQRGNRAFAAAAPKLWHHLPLHISTAQNVNTFKTFRKTHLFFLAFGCSATFFRQLLYMVFCKCISLFYLVYCLLMLCLCRLSDLSVVLGAIYFNVQCFKFENDKVKSSLLIWHI